MEVLRVLSLFWFLENILKDKKDYLKKKESLKKLNYDNSWTNVNQKILININEN